MSAEGTAPSPPVDQPAARVRSGRLADAADAHAPVTNLLISPAQWASIAGKVRSSWLYSFLVGAAAAAALLSLILILLKALDWYITPQTVQDRKDLVAVLAQILAGTVILIGLYFTRRTVQLNQQGQVTERFTHAIDQLGATDTSGNPRLEIRLGAIYALERIARDSDRDHWPIMEILTAYVRERAPWREGAFEPERPPTDIQAVLTVLGRRNLRYGNGETHRLDLRATDLRRAELQEAHLEGADLPKAHLENAYLPGIHFEGAHLTYAHLQGAILRQACLARAYLEGAHLEGAELFGAHLEIAYLVGAHLERAQLCGARLDGARLGPAYLQGACCWGAHLTRVNMMRAHLEDADLCGADLEGADLTNAHLEGADLSQTLGLTVQQVRVAHVDVNTKLPPEIRATLDATQPPTPATTSSTRETPSPHPSASTSLEPPETPAPAPGL